MAHDFPADLVKTTDKFSTELSQFDGISVDDVARLWKAYTTQSAVVRDVVVSRLENLFWRIWGNAAIQQSLSGSVLATLFLAINEEPSLNITNYRPPSKGSTSTTSNNVTKIQHDDNDSPPKNERKNPLPPILKKSTDGTKSVPPSEPSSHKTTRILVPEKPSERPSQKATEDTTSTENGKGSKSASTSATQKPIRKRPTFVANRAASSRRRGVLIRRKSSQTSPVTSPAVEETEDSFQEQIQAQEEARQEEQAKETTAPPSPAKDAEISWRSMSYLKKFDEDSRNALTEREGDTSGTSPPPTNFSVSSVRHHRSPEEHFRVASQENAQNGMVSDKSLVEQDFRTNFIQRQRQVSAFTTRNNSAASPLTTRLSSTNFREMLNAAEAAAAAASMQRKDSSGAARSLSPGPRYILLPKHDGPINVSSTMASPRRKSDGRDHSRRPIIINTSSSSNVSPERRPDDKEPGSNYPSAAAVSESVISTSQQTTTGVFSVPKESQELLGEQLANLIKGKGKENKTKRGQRIGS
ncbi:hypothetical protein TMatcc_006928 [Talaromyces marneffei ATCC 18224]|uniref:Nitrogen regulatory protein areA GATA-like domain-containing protein n=1 Tax=Talaromyces marneffei (strain ATCC 18224 / CBS 334.59 / QM 7333) TaxID=441960 RepID=B6QDY4_TALMQ|nr:uncharacterized protein EYB26_003926 [Talaromyces marneffei]EEA23855.1 conserved hypothetical protein [Talaromyces marneffei ATCC 18224]KAE8553626.1 hypothetical protein EYB25_005008 [Talaromyces marneffei]QGA16259.1 hypothetical protein EYB26_003926 [Talaromyces marneffei]